MSDYKVAAEGLQDFFKNRGKKRLNVSKQLAKTAIKNPRRALDITANNATAAASRSPKNVRSTPAEVIYFYHTGRGLYLQRFV